MLDCQRTWNFQKLTFFLGLFGVIRELTLDASRVGVLLKHKNRCLIESKVEFVSCADPTDHFPSLSSFGTYRIVAVMPRDVFPILCPRIALTVSWPVGVDHPYRTRRIGGGAKCPGVATAPD
jgi:hypothetical protein